MNHTTNLHLPQWEADDRIMMADFNAAFQAIDAGVAANANVYAKIKSMTTSAETTQIDFDVSDVDFTDYLKAELFVVSPDFSGRFQMRVNQQNSGYYVRALSSGGEVTATTSYFAEIPERTRAPITLTTPRAGARVGGSYALLGYQNNSIFQYACTCMAPCNWEDLESFQFIATTGSFPEGTKIVLCGVKT